MRVGAPRQPLRSATGGGAFGFDGGSAGYFSSGGIYSGGGGGGGSSFVAPTATAITLRTGTNAGDGTIVITYTPDLN